MRPRDARTGAGEMVGTMAREPGSSGIEKAEPGARMAGVGTWLRAVRRLRSACARVLIAAALVALGGACQTPQRRISVDDLMAQKSTVLREARDEIDRAEASSNRRIEAEYRAASTDPSAPAQSYDVLVLSGGGAFGAFGAGFLSGWGSVADPELARPHFDRVAGISTGALIGSYAFIGTPASYESLVAEYENPGKNWVRRRGLIPILPGNVSLYDVSEFRRHVRGAVNPDFVAGLAEGAAEDRVLIVGATNVDYGIFRVWDAARIARDSPDDEAAEEIASILSASSAIPGAFPPVEIDQLLYVDGAAAMQVVGGMDDRGWLYGSSGDSSEPWQGEAPIRVRVWIIVNQKLRPDPMLVQSRWTTIAARSLSILLRTSLLESLQDAETVMQLLNARPEYDAILRYVAIPQDFEIPESDRMFDPKTMRALVELGRRMGADPSSWRTRALQPGAPYRMD